jgi:hypothetical protein
MPASYATNRVKIGAASRKRADCWLFASGGPTESNPPITKAGFTVLPRLDGDNWRNQSSAASKFAGEIV